MKNLKIRNSIKAWILAATLVGGGATLASCANSQSSYSSTVNYNTLDELLKDLPEGIKKDNILNIYNTLYNLNGDIANSVKIEADQNKLFQLDWDTIQALILASNDFTSQEMLDMLDTYDEYDADYLYALAKNFSSIFIPFGERLVSSTGFSNLIRDEEQRGDFLKYENILIDINIARKNNDEVKEKEALKTAFAYIRNDFLSNMGGSAFANEVKDQDKATGYSFLSIAYINTIIELGRNSEYKLSDSELKELNSDGLCNTALASIEDNLEGYFRKIDALSEEDTVAYDGAYAKARDIAILSLTTENLYFKDWESSTLVVNSKSKTEIENNTVPKGITSKVNTGKKNKVISQKKKVEKKKYNSLEELKKNEPAKIVKEAEKQKEEIDKKIEKENEEKKQVAVAEAEEKAKEESQKNKEESDKYMQSIKDNATVKDPDGNVDEDKNVVQPTNPNEAIGDVELEKEFDGPVYDANGNIIAMNLQKSFVNTFKVLVKSLGK